MSIYWKGFLGNCFFMISRLSSSNSSSVLIRPNANLTLPILYLVACFLTVSLFILMGGNSWSQISSRTLRIADHYTTFDFKLSSSRFTRDDSPYLSAISVLMFFSRQALNKSEYVCWLYNFFDVLLPTIYCSNIAYLSVVIVFLMLPE